MRASSGSRERPSNAFHVVSFRFVTGLHQRYDIGVSITGRGVNSRKAENLDSRNCRPQLALSSFLILSVSFEAPVSNPTLGVKRPKPDSNEDKTPAIGEPKPAGSEAPTIDTLPKANGTGPCCPSSCIMSPPPPKPVVLDTTTGRQVAAVPIADDTDDRSYDRFSVAVALATSTAYLAELEPKGENHRAGRPHLRRATRDHDAGSSTTNVAPRPNWLSHQTRPFIAWTNFFHHGETKASRVFAARRLGRQTSELAKELFLIVRTQPGTLVLHLHADGVFGLNQPHENALAWPVNT